MLPGRENSWLEEKLFVSLKVAVELDGRKLISSTAFGVNEVAGEIEFSRMEEPAVAAGNVSVLLPKSTELFNEPVLPLP